MSRKRRIIVVDCETDPFLAGRVPEPFLWDVYDGKSHYTFEHTSDCIHYLMQQDAICYAHNGGKFDYHQRGFLTEMEEYDPVMIINGRLAKFSIGLCEFRDSMNILPIGLAQFEKISIDYSKLERRVRRKHMAEITRYLHGDTESLYKLVMAFVDTYGVNLTLAGAAMRFWQDYCRKEAPRSSPGFYALCAPYYYGGRVQAFTKGVIRESFRVFDINSAYPHAMLEEHPFSTDGNICVPRKTETIIPQSLYCVRARSKGSVPSRTDGKCEFTSDENTREICCTGWEILAGVETDTLSISQVLRRIDFRETINFKRYITYFYDMKRHAGAGVNGRRSPEYIFAKLFMNSLYGKFGSQPDAYHEFHLVKPGNEPRPDNMTGTHPSGTLGPWSLIQSNLADNKKRWFNVATAASITGYVRARLHRTIHAINKMDGMVHYCDTDSIAFRGKVPPTVILGTELGEWTDECDAHGEFTRGYIGGRKLYAFHHKDRTWKTASKGTKLTPQEIMKVASGKVVTYNPEVPVYSPHKAPYFAPRKVRMV